MTAAAGAGPMPIHHKSLTADKLSAAILKCLSPECVEAARRISKTMSTEHGVQTAVQSFHKCLPRAALACDLIPDEIAVWTYDKAGKERLKLSTKAVSILSHTKKLDVKDLKL